MNTTPSTNQDELVNILLVDDRLENLTALAAVLDRPGYRLMTASSGAEALRLVLRESFAVVLLDVVMPVMDGIEVATMIKARERSRALPIIFLTAAGMDVERIFNAYALGAVDYLVRPIQAEVMRAKVDVFADLYRKTEEIKRQAKLLREREQREREREVADLKSRHEQRYRDLAESIPQMVWRAMPDGRVTHFTQRWCEYTGLTEEESLEWRWLSAVHPAEAYGIRAQWLSSVHTGTRFNVECRIQRNDGQFGWFMCQALPEKEGGVIVGWLGAYTDIDEKKRGDEERAELLRKAQVARKRAEEMQHRISVLAEVSRLASESLEVEGPLAKVADLLISTVCDGCVIELFDENERIVPVATRHRSPSEARRIEQRIAVIGTLAKDGLFTVEQALSVEAGCLCVPLEARSSVIVGRLTLLSSAARTWEEDEVDFTHDIGRRTALTAMVLHIQTLGRSLRRETKKPFSLAEAIHKIEAAEQQLSRLTRLIDALLDVSRIAARRLTLNIAEMDLSNTVCEVATRFAEVSVQEGTPITLFAEAPVVGNWDPLRVEQVVTNLVSNAIKYGHGHPIEITTRVEGQLAHLIVQDHGIGIAEEHLSRIFDRFERAVPSTSYAGLGLGLYITQQIVTAHGGSVEVESELGKGSEFHVWLPIGE
jgi:PAS domain S-box-containing protein